MSVLQIKELTKTYGLRTILDKISFTINEGEKIGVVGLNGQGKSTLFKIITNQEEYDSGELILKKDLVIKILKQEPELPENNTAREYLNDAFKTVISLHEELAEIEKTLQSNPNAQESILTRQNQIHDQLNHLKGWEFKHKIDTVLNKLGIDNSDQLISEMSTGLQKRVALARLLLEEPEFLLLDEPTNHLDTESIGWLENWIKNFNGACLFVTHDRYFLDRLTNKIIEVNDQKIYISNGNYQNYLEARKNRITNAVNQKNKLNKLLQAEIAFLKQGVKARGTKARYRFTKAETLKDDLDQIIIPKEFNIHLSLNKLNNNRMLETESLSGGYHQNTLFENLDFKIDVGQIIGVIGRNGTGKSTLLKIIEGQTPPLKGKIIKGKGVKVGTFSQNFEHFDLEENLIKNLNGGLEYFDQGNKKIRVDNLLEGLLFSKSDMLKKVKDLSGGEKARLTLAKLICEGANLLLFDEPTNNLDLPTLQILESFLTEFSGAAIVVTHDRYFLDKIADNLIIFNQKGCDTFNGTYELYKDSNKAGIEENDKDNEPKKSKAQKIKTNDAKVNNKIRFEFAALEKEIEQLETEQVSLQKELAEQNTWSNPTIASEKNKRLSEIMNRLPIAMNRWEELAELF